MLSSRNEEEKEEEWITNDGIAIAISILDAEGKGSEQDNDDVIKFKRQSQFDV